MKWIKRALLAVVGVALLGVTARAFVPQPVRVEAGSVDSNGPTVNATR